MYLNLEILDQYEPDEEIDWLKEHFPNGGELVDIFACEEITPEVLHWCYINLTMTAAEIEAYWKRLNVDCENITTIYESDNVWNSKWVSRSSNIDNSSYIFSSKNVAESENILLSEDVIDSRRIFGSEFVYSSNRIAHSKNVTNSRNIVNSDYIVNSHSVMNSAAVTNSAFCDAWSPGNTKHIKDCRFIMDCINLKHCLFCHNISDGEYLIFNKQVDAADYDLIVKQLDKILERYEPELVVDDEWPSNIIALNMPRVNRNIATQHKDLPSTFWRWVKTLPGYDPSILYEITFNKELI